MEELIKQILDSQIKVIWLEYQITQQAHVNYDFTKEKYITNKEEITFDGRKNSSVLLQKLILF